MSAQFPAVIVVRNEEALIRCLESVAWCEERIAIDMDTTDRTRELPKLGVRLCAQVATGDGAAGVWLPRMLLVRSPTAAHRRLPGLPAAVLSRGAGLYPGPASGARDRRRLLFLPVEEDAWILHERHGQWSSRSRATGSAGCGLAAARHENDMREAR